MSLPASSSPRKPLASAGAVRSPRARRNWRRVKYTFKTANRFALRGRSKSRGGGKKGGDRSRSKSSQASASSTRGGGLVPVRPRVPLRSPSKKNKKSRNSRRPLASTTRESMLRRLLASNDSLDLSTLNALSDKDLRGQYEAHITGAEQQQCDLECEEGTNQDSTHSSSDEPENSPPGSASPSSAPSLPSLVPPGMVEDDVPPAMGETEHAFVEALEILRERLPEGHPDIARSLCSES